MTNILKLKNGSEEEESLIAVTMMSLDNLVQTYPIVAYELVEICRNPAHKPFGNSGDRLQELGLMQNGIVHESVKNIVLSAFEGEGFDIKLTYPLKLE